jgi:hypothetical protein
MLGRDKGKGRNSQFRMASPIRLQNALERGVAETLTELHPMRSTSAGLSYSFHATRHGRFGGIHCIEKNLCYHLHQVVADTVPQGGCRSRQCGARRLRQHCCVICVARFGEILDGRSADYDEFLLARSSSRLMIRYLRAPHLSPHAGGTTVQLLWKKTPEARSPESSRFFAGR